MRQWEKLTYTNTRGESIDFSRASAYHTNFKDVSGLSDVRPKIYSTSSMGQDGATHISTVLEPRDIEISGYFKATTRAEKNRLRRAMLKILEPKAAGTLTYTDGEVERSITCYLDTAPLFDRGYDIFERFEILFRCLDPYWRTTTETRNDIALWESLFEFPTETGGLELDDDWQLGLRSASQIVEVYNVGDIETGIRAEFRATGTVTNPYLLDMDNQDEYVRLLISMQQGDVLTISTGYADKRATLLHDGVETDALRYLDTTSTFIQLQPDVSQIKYGADTGLSNLEVTLYHHDRFLGV